MSRSTVRMRLAYFKNVSLRIGVRNGRERERERGGGRGREGERVREGERERER